MARKETMDELSPRVKAISAFKFNFAGARWRGSVKPEGFSEKKSKQEKKKHKHE